jgi:pyridoxal phosphate enzyme (YggS family)
MSTVAQNIEKIKHVLPKHVNLVAVSKKKPNDLVLEALHAGQMHLGENYVQELCRKAAELPSEIRWHMIGHLQTNKVNQLVKGVPNLHLVETVDSVKLADALNAACAKFRTSGKLGVLVEVASSREASKTGAPPDAVSGLVRHILEKCEQLEFRGLMTVAEESRPSECFAQVHALKDEIAREVSLPYDWVLSMGMSGDWEVAVQHGSNQVRIGSAIFGSR